MRFVRFGFVGIVVAAGLWAAPSHSQGPPEECSGKLASDYVSCLKETVKNLYNRIEKLEKIAATPSVPSTKVCVLISDPPVPVSHITIVTMPAGATRDACGPLQTAHGAHHKSASLGCVEISGHLDQGPAHTQGVLQPPAKNTCKW